MRAGILVLSLLSVAAAFADIDLTPRTRTNQFGTFAASWVQFLDGDNKISVSLESDTQVTSADGGAVFRFGNIPQATVSLSRSPFSAMVPFDEEGLVQYQKAAIQMLPPSAEGLVREEAVADVETINGKHSYRFTFSFTIAGTPMRKSIHFVNIDDRQQIVIQTGAFAKDFPAASARATNIIRDWHPTTTAEEQGIN